MLIEKDLMMGAAALQRRWEQHHPATILWLIQPGQHVGWILLTGLNNSVAPRVANRSLEIRRVSESHAMLRFLVSAPGLDETAITRERWHLPGLRMAVEQADGVRFGGMRWNDHIQYGRCLEVIYSIPASVPLDTPALALRPEPG